MCREAAELVAHCQVHGYALLVVPVEAARQLCILLHDESDQSHTIELDSDDLAKLPVDIL